MTHALPFARALRTRNVYSASSADQLPQMLAAFRMFGHLALIPVPDLDRTDYFLIFGANPVVSNGSLMTAPNMKGRLRAIRDRGGRVVVVDPRRTETAEIADEHVAIRPGTDALLLAAMLHVVFAEGWVRLGRFDGRVKNVDALAAFVRELPPERVARRTGVAAGDHAPARRRLRARDEGRVLRPGRALHAAARDARLVARAGAQSRHRTSRRGRGHDAHDAGRRCRGHPVAARPARDLRSVAQPRRVICPSSAATCRWPRSPTKSKWADRAACERSSPSPGTRCSPRPTGGASIAPSARSSTSSRSMDI